MDIPGVGEAGGVVIQGGAQLLRAFEIAALVQLYCCGETDIQRGVVGSQVSSLGLGSALDAAGCEPGYKVFLQREKQQHDGNADDDGASGESTPFRSKVTDIAL